VYDRNGANLVTGAPNQGRLLKGAERPFAIKYVINTTTDGAIAVLSPLLDVKRTNGAGSAGLPPRAENEQFAPSWVCFRAEAVAV
jgi:hypothetical protein